MQDEHLPGFRDPPPSGSNELSSVRAAWPDGKRFAFTVFDDTDLETIDNGPRVYNLIGELGFRTTKSVWPLPGRYAVRFGGATCAEPKYLRWVQELQGAGFEIALHNVTFHTSPRKETIAGLDRFRELFGSDPKTHANHTGCGESIYWGDARLSGRVHTAAYNTLTRCRARNAFKGHVEGSSLFWGDVCRERISYVRNFVFAGLDTLAHCPQMPYHDPARPYVEHWFAASEGPNLRSFVNAISEQAQDELEASGGACVMYTHFGAGFEDASRVDAEFARLMRRLAQKDGWFVPVETLLDHIVGLRGPHEITAGERARLERQWLLHKLRVGPS